MQDTSQKQCFFLSHCRRQWRERFSSPPTSRGGATTNEETRQHTATATCNALPVVRRKRAEASELITALVSILIQATHNEWFHLICCFQERHIDKTQMKPSRKFTPQCIVSRLLFYRLLSYLILTLLGSI